ncbi:PhnD/SsuA/transferrin family substrate-binding protein [Fundidesulfovibrio butyratiphilus]
MFRIFLFVFLCVLLPQSAVLAHAFKIGVLANRGVDFCQEQWKPTATSLEKLLHIAPIEIVPLRFDEVSNAVTQKRIDFLISNSSIYIDMEHRFGVNRIATVRNIFQGHETTHFGGVIFTRSTREDIRSYEDLRGSRFAAVEPMSMGGWLSEWGVFKQAGINPQSDFDFISFLGTHDAVVRAVVSGQVDAGCVRTDTLEHMVAEGKLDLSEVKVLPYTGPVKIPADFPYLVSTPLYPEWAFARLAHVPDELSRKVAAALFTMTPHAVHDENIVLGWTIPLSYEPVRELLKTLEVTPYERYNRIDPVEVLKQYWGAVALAFCLLLGAGLGLAYMSRVSMRLRASQEQLCRELAARKETQRLLTEKETRIRSLFNSTSDSVILIDPQGIILDINNIAASRRGRTPAELIGQCLYDTLPEQSAVQRRERVARVLTTGRAEFFEEERVGRYFRIRIWPVLNETGAIIHLASFSLEITDFRLSEKALRESEEKYRTVAEFTTDWEYWMGTDGRYLYVSPACRQMTGCDPEEFCADPGLFLRLVHPDDRSMISEHLQWVYSNEQSSCDLNFRLLDPSGEVRWVNHRCSIIRRPDGTLLGRRGCNRDITDRHLIRMELERVKNLLQNLIDSMPSVLVCVDRQGCVSLWNDLASRRARIPFDQARGRPLIEAFDGMDQLSEELLLAQSNSQLRSLPRLERQLDGEQVWEDVTIYPLKDTEKGGAVIRIDDVTRRVRMEELMIQNEKMLSVGGLAAGMAHEINNPLGIIVQAVQNAMRRTSTGLPANRDTAERLGIDLELLHAYLTERNVLKYFDDINQASLRASKIVESMLNFSRRSESRRMVYSLAAVLDKTLELVQSDYDLKKNYDIKRVHFIKEYCPENPHCCFVETELEQVFLNIIKNAAQAMSEKEYEPSQTPTLVLRTRVEGDRAIVELEDNGPGMDETTRKRIMEPFFTTKRVGKGTGLGLSVSYFILTNNYSGDLYVDSQPGQGTRFTVRLALWRPSDAQ